MKIILVAGFTFFLYACAHTPSTILSFSSEFKLSLPSSFVAGGTIFSVGGLSAKSNTGELISGQIISIESEGLPSDFDVRDYPDYLLKIKKIHSESSEVFEKSSGEVDYVYDLESLQILEEGGLKMYTLCKDENCLAFVVKNEFGDHIFSVNSRGISREYLVKVIKGDLNAKY